MIQQLCAASTITVAHGMLLPVMTIAAIEKESVYLVQSSKLYAQEELVESLTCKHLTNVDWRMVPIL